MALADDSMTKQLSFFKANDKMIAQSILLRAADLALDRATCSFATAMLSNILCSSFDYGRSSPVRPIALGGACLGGAAGGAEALIVDRCAHHQDVAAGETSHPALITYTNLIDSDHMGNLLLPTPGHWR